MPFVTDTSVIPLVGQAFLDTLAMREDVNPLDYNELCGSTRDNPTLFTDYSKFPEWAGWNNSHAAGRYQFEPATWREAQAATGVPDFSPASQDVAAWWLAKRDYRARTTRDLLPDLASNTLGYIKSGLQTTWTSINDEFPALYAKAMAALRQTLPGAAPAPQVAPSNAPTPRGGADMVTLTLSPMSARLVLIVLEDTINRLVGELRSAGVTT